MKHAPTAPNEVCRVRHYIKQTALLTSGPRANSGSIRFAGIFTFNRFQDRFQLVENT